MTSIQEQLSLHQSFKQDRKNSPTTTERIQHLIADILNTPVEEINTAQTLSDLGASSIDLIELAVRIEVEFKAPIDTEVCPTDAGNLTITKLISRIENWLLSPSKDGRD